MAKKIQNEEPKDNVLDAIKMLAKERGIEEEELITAVEEGIVTAFRREFSGSASIEHVEAEIDRTTGEIFVYKLVEVVEEVEDEANQIAIEEAKAMDPEIELGDEVEVGIEVEKLGRLAATAAKSAISQKVRDAEYRRINNEFSGRIGELATGIILRKDARNVYVDIDRAEAVLPREGQIRNEIYETNRQMKFLVLCVEEHNGRPSITVSRTSNELVRKLFELEIPEIKSGEVIIQAVSREPGSRSKVAVYSRDENIDAKGSCVGQRGQRVQEIMNELGGEKIDIVDWNEDPALFISEALQPAKVLRVDTEITTNEDGSQDRRAKVIVPDSQFTLAIGRSGQNVRLAARLTGFKIDIKRESEEIIEATQLMGDAFQVVESEGES
jgi:N utilization substance protein A